jgi:aspartate racemase
MTTPAVGIIGGIGPESTIEYYRLILAEHGRLRPGAGGPSIIVNSIDMQRLLSLIGDGDLAGTTDYLATELDRLGRAGADFALLASNTPHIVFDELRKRSPLPLISIVEATRAVAEARGLTRLGLLGTRFTMGGSFYPDVFSKAGISITVPEPGDQEDVHERYMGELVPGLVRPETRAHLVTIVERMRHAHGIQGLILGGTDLSPLFRQSTIGNVEVLDTTRIHVAAALAALLS